VEGSGADDEGLAEGAGAEGAGADVGAPPFGGALLVLAFRNSMSSIGISSTAGVDLNPKIRSATTARCKRQDWMMALTVIG
jgi:hypothetical protein